MESKIPVSLLINDFKRMLSERWAYGTEIKAGQVDCSGAFVWSYKQHGHSIYHGSNRMARVEVEKLIPIKDAKITPGMAAFKHRKPGDSGYALPASYKTGGAYYNGDLNDYYHVGLIDEDTARVLNAQSASTGFVASPITQNWSHVAYLNQIDYGSDNILSENDDNIIYDENENNTVTTAVVYAETGSTVKMRASASTTERLWWPVPIGSEVLVRGEADGEWTPIAWGGHQGYMMTVFLKEKQEEQTNKKDEKKEDFSSYACIFYDLTYEQAVNLKSEISEFKSYIEGRNG